MPVVFLSALAVIEEMTPMRRRSLWLAGLLGLALVGWLVIYRCTTRHDRVNLEAFRHIESRMTQAEVEEVLGGTADFDSRTKPLPPFPPSYGRYSLVERNEPFLGYRGSTSGFSGAPRQTPTYTLAWSDLGLRKIIIVTFEESGRFAHAQYLELSYRAQPPFLHRLYAWLGL
jgi:hypothetical protein